MKKMVLTFLICFTLCGCGNQTKSYETKCSLNATLNDLRINSYSWSLIHDNKKIIKKKWSRSYEYKTLSEAIDEEKRFLKECEGAKYYCNASRRGKIIEYYISYNCGEKSPNNDVSCDYVEELKSLEQNGWECIEIDTNK